MTMLKWERWLESWVSEGGRTFMLFLGVLIGIGMVYVKMDYGKEFLAGFVGALMTNLQSVSSRKT